MLSYLYGLLSLVNPTYMRRSHLVSQVGILIILRKWYIEKFVRKYVEEIKVYWKYYLNLWINFNAWWTFKKKIEAKESFYTE